MTELVKQETIGFIVPSNNINTAMAIKTCFQKIANTNKPKTIFNNLCP